MQIASRLGSQSPQSHRGIGGRGLLDLAHDLAAHSLQLLAPEVRDLIQALAALVRHLGREKLSLLLERADFNDMNDRVKIAENLEAAVADVLRIAQEMRDGAAGQVKR